MFTSYIVEEAQARYQYRVSEADDWRLVQQVGQVSPKLSDRLRLHLGERLIAIGLRLKEPTRPATVSQ